MEPANQNGNLNIWSGPTKLKGDSEKPPDRNAETLKIFSPRWLYIFRIISLVVMKLVVGKMAAINEVRKKTNDESYFIGDEKTNRSILAMICMMTPRILENIDVRIATHLLNSIATASLYIKELRGMKH